MTPETTPRSRGGAGSEEFGALPRRERESPARNALLASEIELRRHIEAVAAERRAPPGGAVEREYRFEGENGPVTLAELFADKDTLVVYSYMFGLQRAPCPMCTSFMASLVAKVPDFEQRIAPRRPCRSAGWSRRGTPAVGQARSIPTLGRLHPRLRQRRGRRRARIDRVQPPRRHHPPLLERRDQRRDGRSGHDPRGAPDRRPALDPARPDAGRPRRTRYPKLEYPPAAAE